MEKDIDRIQKNQETDIVIRIDDFNGKKGVTIREFVKSERYTGFTKAGTRIPADKFAIFKASINSISEKELMEPAESKPDPKYSGQNAGARSSNFGQSSTQPSQNGSKPVAKKPINDIEEMEF